MAIFGQAVPYIEANQIIAKNGKNLSQIIDNNWTKVVLIWMLKVTKNGKKR